MENIHEVCEKVILGNSSEGILVLDYQNTEFDYKIRGTLTGGTIVKTLSGIELRVYRTRSDFNDVPDIGVEGLAIHAPVSSQMAPIASADIEVTSEGYTVDLDSMYTVIVR